jgi:hypothetical protein
MYIYHTLHSGQQSSVDVLNQNGLQRVRVNLIIKPQDTVSSILEFDQECCNLYRRIQTIITDIQTIADPREWITVELNNQAFDHPTLPLSISRRVHQLNVNDIMEILNNQLQEMDTSPFQTPFTLSVIQFRHISGRGFLNRIKTSIFVAPKYNML